MYRFSLNLDGTIECHESILWEKVDPILISMLQDSCQKKPGSIFGVAATQIYEPVPLHIQESIRKTKPEIYLLHQLWVLLR